MRSKLWQRWQNWIHRLTKPVTNHAPRRSGAARPVLEVLETREMPAMVIVPTFAANINADPAAATIKATINEAISVIEANFADPITVNITFQEGGPGLGGSLDSVNGVSYTAYRAALLTHATTVDDTTADATLPAGPNDPVTGMANNMILSSAMLKALGLPSGAPASDGTITLNTSICNLSRAGAQNPANYDLLAVASHEIDEVLGFGSAMNGLAQGAPSPNFVSPDDLFRYSAPGVRSFDTLLATNSYFSIDGGTTKLASYNQTFPGDYSDWFSSPAPVPEVQDAFGTPGATPDLGVELRRLDVDGYKRVAVAPPVVTTSAQPENPGIPSLINLGSFTGANTGPWKVTVVWGDASPNTTFFTTNLGALGNQLHTYATAGPYTATVTVTDYTNLSGTSSFQVAGGTTLLSLDASNNLVITDIGGGKNDNLTLQADTVNSQYIISDPSAGAQMVFGSAFPGATISANKHIAYIPFADVAGPSINVNTLGGNDRLAIDNSLGSFSKTINFDGGTGVNTLVGPNLSDTWTISSVNTGAITGLATFKNAQNLIGGAGADDFQITAGGVTGVIAGGGQAGDTLDYSGYGPGPVYVNLATNTATLTGSISGITNAIGNANAASTLTGTNANNTWTFTANNSGVASTFSFASFANLVGGSGADYFNLNGFTLTGSLNGGGGNNSLLGPNNPTVTWNVTASNQGNIPGTLSLFTNIGNLIGSNGDDIFVFAANGTLSGQINGGGGDNWLDYSAFVHSLTINLQTGADSAALGGVTNFNNILGSAVGSDKLTGSAAGGVLVGHGALNALYAGGPSLLIGGYGRNFLIGGAGNDLLINGSTTYDHNIASLKSILSTWQNNSYYVAITMIQSSPTPLVVGSTVFLTPAKPTIGPRFGRGTSLYESALVGNGGLNWYFTTTYTSIADRKPGEVVVL